MAGGRVGSGLQDYPYTVVSSSIFDALHWQVSQTAPYARYKNYVYFWTTFRVGGKKINATS